MWVSIHSTRGRRNVSMLLSYSYSRNLVIKTERVIPPGRIRGSRVRLFIGIHIRISMWSRIRMCIRRRRRVRDRLRHVIRTRRLYSY